MGRGCCEQHNFFFLPFTELHHQRNICSIYQSRRGTSATNALSEEPKIKTSVACKERAKMVAVKKGCATNSRRLHFRRLDTHSAKTCYLHHEFIKDLRRKTWRLETEQAGRIQFNLGIGNVSRFAARFRSENNAIFFQPINSGPCHHTTFNIPKIRFKLIPGFDTCRNVSQISAWLPTINLCFRYDGQWTLRSRQNCIIFRASYDWNERLRSVSPNWSWFLCWLFVGNNGMLLLTRNEAPDNNSKQLFALLVESQPFIIVACTIFIYSSLFHEHKPTQNDAFVVALRRIYRTTELECEGDNQRRQMNLDGWLLLYYITTIYYSGRGRCLSSPFIVHSSGTLALCGIVNVHYDAAAITFQSRAFTLIVGVQISDDGLWLIN